MPQAGRSVVLVDGARTPFGKSGPKGLYADTRADDLVIKCIRELLRRHPDLPKERVEEVAIAATTQIGDQGLTLGRVAALLSGLPNTTPGYSIDRMCAGAMTAVTAVARAAVVRAAVLELSNAAYPSGFAAAALYDLKNPVSGTPVLTVASTSSAARSSVIAAADANRAGICCSSSRSSLTPASQE